MSGCEFAYRGRGGRGRWVAIVELEADECEATAYAFGPSDGVYDEMLQIAEELRAMNAPDNCPTTTDTSPSDGAREGGTK